MTLEQRLGKALLQMTFLVGCLGCNPETDPTLLKTLNDIKETISDTMIYIQAQGAVSNEINSLFQENNDN